MPLRTKSFGCQCSHSWTSCITSSLLCSLFPPRCSFRGPKRWQSDGARSALYGGCGRMFHFSFWMVSIVRAATCGRALSWKYDTDVCDLFLLFLMFLSSIEGVVWLFVSNCYHWSVFETPRGQLSTCSADEAITVLACYGSHRPALIRFILHRFPSFFKSTAPLIDTNVW